MIKIINKTNEKISFNTDLPISLANAIRRSVNYVPTLAIDTLEITKNDSALYDEMVAHRLGLVPLKNEDLKLPEECDCGKEDGCGKCSVKLKLKAVGPNIVYSDELSPKGSVVYKMPIVILDSEQEIELMGIAKMGLGINHAKYSPGIIYYSYTDDLKNEDDENFNKLIQETNKDKNKELMLTVESWGQIPPKEIFGRAIKALNEEIKGFLKKI